MRVIEVDPSGDERWERYVTAHPHGLIYHRAAWLEVLRSQYGDTFVHLLCLDADGEPAGVLPLCRTKGLPFGLGGVAGASRLSSLPRSPVGGPLASSPQAARSLAEAAMARVQALGGLRLQLKPPREAGDGLGGLVATPADTSYVLELPSRPEDLRFGTSRQHAAIRRAVRKAERSGVQVRAAEAEEELRAWYALYLVTMRKHVAAPRPYGFFRAMWEVLRPAGMLELLLAEDRSGGQARLLSGCLLLKGSPTVVFGFNGRRAEELAVRPNDAIHWHAIHDACAQGFRRYDFGEVPDGNPGLARFKLKWGAEPQRLFRYHWPAVPAGAARHGDGDPSARDRALQVARGAWQHVPLPATALAGRLLYRWM